MASVYHPVDRYPVRSVPVTRPSSGLAKTGSIEFKALARFADTLDVAVFDEPGNTVELLALDVTGDTGQRLGLAGAAVLYRGTHVLVALPASSQLLAIRVG